MTENYIFVLLHSYSGKSSDLLPIENLLNSKYKNPTILKPQIIDWMVSAPKIDKVLNRLLEEIDECWSEKNAQLPKNVNPKIILIGHSMGALFARKLYICACGENSDVPLEEGIKAKDIRQWAYNVDRIILMAGMNNGWKINIHLGFQKNILMSLGSFLEPVLSIFGKPLIYSFRRGGSFITQLKLQSIEMQNVAKTKGVGNATIIQMLGTIDDLVSPEDNIDLISGNNFIYMEMPFSGHKNVIDLDDKKRVFYNEKETTIGKIRSEKLVEALFKTPEQLKSNEILTAESAMINQDESVTDVVFVIHGIRDEGYWTKKVAQRVVKLAHELQDTTTDKNGREVPRKFETETSSYGYFPLLHFALPNYRRAKVQWLMEQYSENMAKYPNAKFSYVGHSNGTYLISKALEEYPACKFRNVLFAGSVVNHNYDWNKMIAAHRVEKVLNIAATSDYVVGIFPNAFHYLGFTELGRAGYSGFLENKSKPDSLNQIVSIPGGHGAGIQESHWDNIAHFIIEGKPKTPIIKDERKRFEINGELAIFAFIFILALIYFIGNFIWKLTPEGEWRTISIEWRTISIIVYLLFVWKVITKY